MEQLQYEPDEVTEADIYVDFAEVDEDVSHTHPTTSPFSVVQSQLAVPLESGEQTVRLAVVTGSNIAGRAVVSGTSYSAQQITSSGQINASSRQSFSKPLPSRSYAGDTTLSSSASHTSSCAAQNTSSALMSRSPAKTVPPGVFAPSKDLPVMHSSSSRDGTVNSLIPDDEEDIDVDTPYDGRLLIQSASRPAEFVSMLSTASVARKSTSKGMSKNSGPSRARTAATARKSTGGLNKMIPKVLQIARKSTTKQRSRSKYSGEKDGSSKVTPDGALLVKIGPSTHKATTNVSRSQTSSAEELQNKTLALPLTTFPFVNDLDGTPTAGNQIPSSSKSSGSSKPKPHSTQSKPSGSKPAAASPSPISKSKLLTPPKPRSSSPANPTISSSCGSLEQKRTAWNKSVQNIAFPLSSEISSTSASYKASQKTAHRKGVPEQTTPPAKVAPSKAKSTQKKRRLSGAGSESSTSETSEVPAKAPKLHEAETQLSATMALLNEKQELLRSVEEQLASVTTSLQAMLKDKEKLEAQNSKVSVRLVSLTTAARPYDCPICTDAFQLALSCPCSFRQYAKDKPLQCKHSFRCKHCSALFTDQTLLEAHIDLHISDKSPHLVAEEKKSTPVISTNQSEEVKKVETMSTDLKQTSIPKPTTTPRSTATHMSTLTSKSSGTPKLVTTPKSNITPKPAAAPKSISSPKLVTTPESNITPKLAAAPKSNITPKSAAAPKSNITPKSAAAPKSISTPKSTNAPKASSSLKSTAEPAHQKVKSSSSHAQKPLSGQDSRKTRATCHVCGKKFEYYCYLAKHVKVHASIYTCAYCQKAFSQKSVIIDHFGTEHVDKQISVACKVCRKRFQSISELEKHVVIHMTHVRNGCSVCGRQFNWPKNLARHLQDVHKEQGSLSALKTILAQGDYQCVKCGKSFLQPTSLVLHDETFHADGDVSHARQSNPLVAGSFEAINEGAKQQSRKQQPNSSKASSGQNSLKMLSKTANRKKIGDICHKATLSRQMIASQLSACAKQRERVKGLYSCKLCGLYSSNNRPCLQKHIRKKHPESYVAEGGSTTYKCTVCGLVFIRYKRLVQHIHNCHPDQLHILKKLTKGLKCGKCGKSFPDQKGLNFHLHTDHPPKGKDSSSQCSLCSRRFLHNRNILRHMRDIHGLSETAPSSENNSDSQNSVKNVNHASKQMPSFKSKKKGGGGLLQEHTCRVCKATFAELSCVYRHMRNIHPGVPIYQCSKCGEGFVYAKAYTEHQCQPKSEEDCRYRCHTCGMGFHIAWEWTKHVQEHTSQSGESEDLAAANDGMGNIISPTAINIKTEHLFRCVDCGDTFDDEESWAQHACDNEEAGISYLKDDPVPHKSPSVETHSGISEIGIKTNAGPVQCPLCARTLAASSLRKHFQHVHHAKIRECKPCSLVFTNVLAYQRHWSEHEGNYQPPTVNSQKNIIKDKVENHINTKDSQGPLLHGGGQATCSDKNPLLLKIKLEPCTIPEPEDPVQCSVCLKMFSPLYIKKHMRQVHSLHMFRCKKCGVGFTDQLYFDRHMLQHREDELRADYQLTANSCGNISEHRPDSLDSVLSDSELKEVHQDDKNMMKRVYGTGTVNKEVEDQDMDFMITENNSESEPDENRDREPSASQRVDDLITAPVAKATDADREDDATDIYNEAAVYSDMELEESGGRVADLADTELAKTADVLQPDAAPDHVEKLSRWPNVELSEVEGFRRELAVDAAPDHVEKLSSSPNAELSEVEGFRSELAVDARLEVQHEEEMASSPAAVFDDVQADLVADDTETAPSDTDIAETMAALPVMGTSGQDLLEQDTLYPDLPEEMLCSPVACLLNKNVDEELGGDPAVMISDSEALAVASPGKLEDQPEHEVGVDMVGEPKHL